MSDFPVLLIVAFVFAGVVFASMRKVHLGLAALGGGLAFAIIRGIPLMEAGRIAAAELLDPDSILLLVLVTMIMILSGAMKNSGARAAFAKSVQVVAPGPRASLVITPLLIGTLPMPGGALLSAPLVDALDTERRQGAEGLSAINYWFRHALELFWPLYPAFILTCSLSGIPTFRLSLLNMYAPISLIMLGQFFVINGNALPPAAAPQHTEKRSGTSAIAGLAGRLEGFAPLGLVLALFLALGAAMKALLAVLELGSQTEALLSRYIPTLGGIAGSMLYVGLRRGFSSYRGTLTLHIAKLAAVIAGIRVFAALLESGGIATEGAAELAAMHIPPLAVACILPLIAGLVSGVGFAYVGIAFPIVLGLFPAGSSLPLEVVVMLAGAFGYAGMMLSPLHVCLVVTAGHFETSSTAVLRRLVLPLGIFLVIAGLYAAILSTLF